MVTVQTVFDMAIHLMDEQNESTGSTMTQDTREYEVRTISILNSIIPVLAPYSAGYELPAEGRPVPAILLQDDHNAPNFTQYIQLDDTICLSLLPYYLAAHLRVGEDNEAYAIFMARYRDAYADVITNTPGVWEAITTPYGLF